MHACMHSFMPIHACPLVHNHADHAYLLSHIQLSVLTCLALMQSPVSELIRWRCVWASNQAHQVDTLAWLFFSKCFNGKWDFLFIDPNFPPLVGFFDRSFFCGTQFCLPGGHRQPVPEWYGSFPGGSTDPNTKGFFAKIIDDFSRFRIPAFFFFGRKTGFRPCQSKTILECCVMLCLISEAAFGFFSDTTFPPHPSIHFIFAKNPQPVQIKSSVGIIIIMAYFRCFQRVKFNDDISNSWALETLLTKTHRGTRCFHGCFSVSKNGLKWRRSARSKKGPYNFEIPPWGHSCPFFAHAFAKAICITPMMIYGSSLSVHQIVFFHVFSMFSMFPTIFLQFWLIPKIDSKGFLWIPYPGQCGSMHGEPTELKGTGNSGEKWDGEISKDDFGCG